MANDKQLTQSTTLALQNAGLLVVLYIILILLLPASKATMQAYDLSNLEYRIILLAATLPSTIAWFAAFVGYSKLRQYALMVRKTPEGEHFDRLATGSAWLAWSLPLSSLAALLLNAISYRWHDFHPTAIILSNYLNLLLALIAFSIIGTATRSLVGGANLRFSLSSSRIIAFIFLALGVIYCYLIFRRFDSSSLTSADNPYFLPLWLMVISITIPYLYAWFVGLLAAYEITIFSKNVQGVLYRQALRLLVGGLVTVVLSLTALQYLNGVQPRVGYLLLDYRLVLSSLFRLIGALGFILMTLGAIRLKRIEEV